MTDANRDVAGAGFLCRDLELGDVPRADGVLAGQPVEHFLLVC